MLKLSISCVAFLLSVTLLRADDDSVTADRRWFVGSLNIKGTCYSVGGLALQLPFRYENYVDCLSNKTYPRYNVTLPRQDGYMKNNGECLPVYGHARSNPFSFLTKKSCEDALDHRLPDISTLDADSRRIGTRAMSSQDAWQIAKIVVDFTLAGLSIVFPPAGLLAVLLQFMWPSHSEINVWSLVQDKVEALINQKVNARYALNLKHYLTDLHKEMKSYNDLRDSDANKGFKIVAMETNIALRESMFMDKEDQIGTLAFFVPFATARTVILMEVIRMTPPAHKQSQYVRLIRLLMKYIAFLSDMVFSQKLQKYRSSQITCRGGVVQLGPHVYLMLYTMFDATLQHSEEMAFDLDGTGSRPSLEDWCNGWKKAQTTKIDAFLNALKANVAAWATLFQAASNDRYFLGFSNGLTSWTVDDEQCKIPFTYKNTVYTGCTSVDRTKSWCYTKDGSRKSLGECKRVSVSPSTLDLTSCRSPDSGDMQYYGHQTTTASGKACRSWSSSNYNKPFPMDGGKRAQAKNYCRHFSPNELQPWCYTGDPNSNSWEYCSIRKCTKSDWN